MHESESPATSSLRGKRVIAIAVAVLGAPLVGAIAGAIVMSWLMPGEQALFGAMYALFGGGVAVAVTLLVGLPAYWLVVHRGYPLFPWLLALALLIGQGAALMVPCLVSRSQCGHLHVYNAVFALVASIVTALLVVRIAKEVR